MHQCPTCCRQYQQVTGLQRIMSLVTVIRRLCLIRVSKSVMNKAIPPSILVHSPFPVNGNSGSKRGFSFRIARRQAIICSLKRIIFAAGSSPDGTNKIFISIKTTADVPAAPSIEYNCHQSDQSVLKCKTSGAFFALSF